LELELPLKVIAPIFFAAQKTTQRPKVAVSSEIPDLFFSFPQAAPAPAPTPAVPTAGLAGHPSSPSEARHKSDSQTNFYVWGDEGEVPKITGEATRQSSETDFTNRQAHPRDVVTRAMTLPGVAGAVVSMMDGLCVASRVPAELNADSLAAFLPQIFERVNQSTRELRMGVLNNVNFTVGNVPWKIFRIGSIYFAAFGRAGEDLPTQQLVQLAAELDRKKQH
jgi:predicted regulator of Ras-like GTPase activity (Roadblock/LC7/MglB family)